MPRGSPRSRVVSTHRSIHGIQKTVFGEGHDILGVNENPSTADALLYLPGIPSPHVAAQTYCRAYFKLFFSEPRNRLARESKRYLPASDDSSQLMCACATPRALARRFITARLGRQLHRLAVEPLQCSKYTHCATTPW